MPRTARPTTVHPIVLRTVSVLDAYDVTPHMRRLVLGGDELAAFSTSENAFPAFASTGFDDHVKLVIPNEDGSLPHAGTQGENAFNWDRQALIQTRDYTVRSVAADGLSFTLDFVKHDGGLAADWSERAAVGDRISFAGPKTCAQQAPDARHHVLIADETALPAVARWCEEAGPDDSATILVELPSRDDVQELVSRARIDAHWLIRDPNTAPGHSTLLLDELRTLPPFPQNTFAWCAGETLTIAPIRQHLRHDRDLDRENVEVVGYWRLPEQALTAKLTHEAHELTELLPPIVTRIAATLGIGPLVESKVNTPEALAERTGVPQRTLGPLLDAMQAIGILEFKHGRLANTALGRVLATDTFNAQLDQSDPANRSTAQLGPLLALFTEHVSGDGPDADRIAQTESRLEFIAQPLADLPEVRSADTVHLAGHGLGDLDAHVRARNATVVTLPDSASPSSPGSACTIAVRTLEGSTDAEAARTLADYAKTCTTLVVVEDSAANASADDHAAERSLASLAATGVPLRSPEELAHLLRSAGFADVQPRSVGWGFAGFDTILVATA